MTAPPPPLPVPDTSTATTTHIDDLIDKAHTSPFIEGVRKRVEVSVGLARRLGQPSPEHIQDEAYLLMTIDDLADALRAVLASRDALAAREARTLAAAREIVKSGFWAYHNEDRNGGKWRYYYKCEMCGGESTTEETATVKHAESCPVAVLVDVLDAPVSSAPTSTEAGP